MSMNWLKSAWGKFKGWQRICAQPQRLTREQLQAAWQVWDLMCKTEAAAVASEDGWRKRLHDQTVTLALTMPEDLRKGPRVFSAWLRDNKDKLARETTRAVANKAHTKDSVSAELIR